jgi:hypothetical protein
MAPTPILLDAIGGQQQVTLNWSDESADPSVAGYKVYYDQAGKAQLVVNISDPTATTFVNTGLTNGVEYCYKVTSYYNATCESGYSNILCAIPSNQGQTTDPAGVSQLQTGRYETTGKGADKTTVFVLSNSFAAGETVVIRVLVVDATGTPIPNATVAIQIGGPEQVALNSNPSDADGIAEAHWSTQSPNRKGQGGTTPGGYTATTTDVTASGYHWDGVMTSTTFVIQ